MDRDGLVAAQARRIGSVRWHIGSDCRSAERAAPVAAGEPVKVPFRPSVSPNTRERLDLG